MPSWTDIANTGIAVAAVLMLAGLLWLRKKTRANGFAWKAAAFGWIAFARIMLVAEVHPFVVYSAPLALPFYILFGVGLALTILKLRSVYVTMTLTNGDAERDRIVTAAEVVRKAAVAAAIAVQATADSAAIALAAKERAAHTHRIIEEAERHIANGTAK